MTNESIALNVSPEIGWVSAEYTTPASPICCLTLAHGAGAGMNHEFMRNLAARLAEFEIATLRFNFPFIEQKKKRPDLPAVAHKTIEAVIDEAGSYSLPLYLAGKSFGGRMSSQFLSKNKINVEGIIFYGFPLHPAGKPATERAEHLKQLTTPMLFLQGTKDALAEKDLIDQVCRSLPSSTLKWIEGADHAFKAGKTDTISILAEQTSDWIKKVVSSKY
jgi:uncharacterized protein